MCDNFCACTVISVCIVILYMHSDFCTCRVVSFLHICGNFGPCAVIHADMSLVCQPICKLRTESDSAKAVSFFPFLSYLSEILIITNLIVPYFFIKDLFICHVCP